LAENTRLAEELGAEVVTLKSRKIADALIEFARREGITHVVFGQSAWSRWDILLRGSVINRFLDEVRDATVQVVPLGDEYQSPVFFPGSSS
jgi:two-component system sensor histidine kinase KdpD